MTACIEARGLRKAYRSTVALDGIDLRVEEGRILGLIGPNGAGKTTLLEGLTGLLPLDGGEVFQGDAPLPASRRKQTMFYLPDGVLPYPELTVSTALAFWANLFGAGKEKLNGINRRLELEAVQSKRVGTLSKGYRRRFLLAVALLSSQPLLILDEPFDGLDLRQMLAVIEFLKETQSAGRTLLLSIHQLSDAERICDRFLLLDAGRMLGFGTLDELRKQAKLSAGKLEEVFLALT